MADAFGPTLDGSLRFLGAVLKSFYLRNRLKRWSREDLLRWQNKRLRWLVKMAHKKSPFYRELYDQAGIDINNFKLDELPTVDKKTLMDNFDAVMTTPEITLKEVEEFCEARLRNEIPYGHFKGRYLPVKSSGSTGEKGLFIFDQSYFRRMFAAMASHRPKKFLPAGILHLRVAALFSPDEFHLATTSFPRLTPIGMKSTFISASADIKDICESLNEAQPNLLAGFPSLVEALCSEVDHGRLKINLGRVVCTGESLTTRTRERIEKTFGCSVYNLYACAEANPIGISYGKRQDYLKVVEDFMILEPVDAQLKAVPIGQRSHSSLLTNLYSTVMPIIRYRMSDQIKFLDTEIGKGSILRIMDNVYGRRPVMIEMRDHQNREVLVQPIALIDLLADDHEVRAIQVRQEKVGQIKILTTLAAGAHEAGAKARLDKTVRDYLLGRGIPVDENTSRLKVLDRIPPDLDSGKVHGFVKTLAE